MSVGKHQNLKQTIFRNYRTFWPCLHLKEFLIKQGFKNRKSPNHLTFFKFCKKILFLTLSLYLIQFIIWCKTSLFVSNIIVPRQRITSFICLMSDIKIPRHFSLAYNSSKHKLTVVPNWSSSSAIPISIDMTYWHYDTLTLLEVMVSWVQSKFIFYLHISNAYQLYNGKALIIRNFYYIRKLENFYYHAFKSRLPAF